MENHEVDWCGEGRTADVVLELVLTTWSGTAEFAPPNLGFCPTCRNPSVTPGFENAGCHSGRGSFSYGDGPFKLFVEDGASLTSFGGVREESVDLGCDDLCEIFRDKAVFEPCGGACLSGTFFFGGAFEDGVPCAVGDGFIGFRKIVGERRVVPPRIVLAWVVVWDGEVGHGPFFVSAFLQVSPLSFPRARDFGSSYHSSLRNEL